MSPSTAAPAKLPTAAVADARPSRRLVLAVTGFVLALGLLGYGVQGGFRFGPPEPAPAAVDASESAQARALLAELAERVQVQPDDAEAWTLMARVQADLGDSSASLAAFRRAADLQPRNAQSLADLAEALALGRQGELDAEVEKLVLRAVRLDPSNQKALGLAGAMAFQRGQYPEALVFWERALRDASTPGVREPLQAAISLARERIQGGRPAAAASAAR